MLLIDVDAFTKLAHWNLLDCVPEIFGCAWTEVATLTSVKLRAQKAIEKPDGKVFLTSAAAQTAFDHCVNLAALPHLDEGRLALFEDMVEIDDGEAVLFSSLGPGDYLLTGDKRALRALCKISGCDQFCGRIWLVEHVVARCLAIYGRDWVLAHICPSRTRDKAISIILGSDCDAVEADIQNGLTSYIAEIDALRDPSVLVTAAIDQGSLA